MASAPRVRVRFGSDVSWLRVPPTYDALLDKLRGRYNLPPQHTITLLVGGARIMDVDELEAGDEEPPSPPPQPLLPVAAASAKRLGRGLANAPGDNNGFLNAAVQALFHVVRFRRALLSRSILPVHEGEPSELSSSKSLLRALQLLCSGLQDPSLSSTCDPTDLRCALGPAAPLKRKADAVEVLSAFLSAFQLVGLAHFPEFQADDTRISRMFSMRVVEALTCPDCGTVSHELAYSSFFHLVAAPALRAVSHDASFSPGLSAFESRLARLLCEDCKGCDRDAGGCGRPRPMEHTLLRLPHVFTLSLTWDTKEAAEADVAATLSTVEPLLRPARIFRGSDERRVRRLGDDPYWEAAPVAAEDAVFELRLMVCFHNAHYLAFGRTEDGHGPWARFDDERVEAVGDWAALVAACVRGRLQPTSLFYEATAAEAKPVATVAASDIATPLPVEEPPASSLCAVCLRDVGAAGARALPCAHAFHAACIDPWLRTRAECPSCRPDLLADVLSDLRLL